MALWFSKTLFKNAPTCYRSLSTCKKTFYDNPNSKYFVKDKKLRFATKEDIESFELEESEKAARLKQGAPDRAIIPPDLTKLNPNDLQNVLGKFPTICLDKNIDGEFEFLFTRSPFAALGPKLIGQIVEGRVSAIDERGRILVDIGVKFPAILTGKKNAQIGDYVQMQLEDIERAEHLLGDSKSTSIHMGLGKYISGSHSAERMPPPKPWNSA